MKRTVLLLSIGQLAWQLHAQSTCATAVAVTVGTYTVDAVNGTEVPSPICAANGSGATHGKWYRFTAAIDTSITVTTDLPVNAGKDTRVHIYAGACGTLACVGGDDDSGTGYLSVATFNVIAGTDYTIAFDDKWSPAGFDFQILQTLPPPPPPPQVLNFTSQGITSSGQDFCVVDMNNDGLDDEVDVSATSIHINYQLSGGGFESTTIATDAAAHMANWSLCAGDLDGNGQNDLMYGSGSGVTFMFANNDGTAFTTLNETDYIFCQRTNMVDINNDGHLDAFSCHDVAANCYYLNDGNNNFGFHQGGLGETCGNYGSVWIDVDNDHDMDLFVAKCGCDPVDILYRNNGDGTFTSEAAAMGFADTQQSWSSAWADFDNDGDMDVIVGTSSGDYQKLMRNDGSVFTNVTAGSGFDTYNGGTIDWMAHDFNNDGWVDVLGGGRMFLNQGDMTFISGTVQPTNGPVGDLNNDGFLDIQNGNVIWMNNANDSNWVKVIPVGTVSNKNGIGARVQITSALGTQIRDIKSGDQFHYMSTLYAYFGIGADTEISNITIYWPSGLVSSVDAPSINSTITIVEDASTNVSTVTAPDGFSLYPTPAQDVLHIRSNEPLLNRTASVTDLTGKLALRTAVRGGVIDVSSLKSGMYLLQLDGNGTTATARFVKQ